MSIYNEVKNTVDFLQVGELVTVSIPDNLKAFRKFLTEISRKDHKCFRTKVVNGELCIMRIKYHSLVEKLESI